MENFIKKSFLASDGKERQYTPHIDCLSVQLLRTRVVSYLFKQFLETLRNCIKVWGEAGRRGIMVFLIHTLMKSAVQQAGQGKEEGNLLQ